MTFYFLGEVLFVMGVMGAIWWAMFQVMVWRREKKLFDHASKQWLEKRRKKESRDE